MIVNERIHYIDALRGFSMFLVVLSHVFFYSFKYTPKINGVIETIHMPLFFFISGLMIKYISITNIKIYIAQIFSRFKHLVIPTLVLGLGYSLLYKKQVLSVFIYDPMKCGYWFTISLFQIYFIYYTIIFLSSKIVSDINRKKFTTSFFLVISILLFTSKYLFTPNYIYSFLVRTSCVWQTSQYIPYFCIGMLIKIFQSEYDKYLVNNHFLLGIITGVFISCLYIYISKLEEVETMLSSVPFIPIRGILLLMIGSSGVLLFNTFFKHESYFFSNKTLVGKFLILVGNNTLMIYLLHYFFLPNLSMAGSFLSSYPNLLLELFVGSCITILIVLICLLLGKICSISPALFKLLLGSK